MPKGTVVLAARGDDGDAPPNPDTETSKDEILAGEDKPVDGLDLVARAEKILTDAGKAKGQWSENEYASALSQAERESKKVAA